MASLRVKYARTFVAQGSLVDPHNLIRPRSTKGEGITLKFIAPIRRLFHIVFVENK